MDKWVYIILVNYNNTSDTDACISSLLANSYPQYRIIVVDNASQKGNIEDITQRYPEVVLIKNHENSGFSIANNIGIEYALQNEAEYIMLLNNDTVVDNGFIENMVQKTEQYNIDVLTCKMCYFSKPDQSWYAGGTIDIGKAYGKHVTDDTYCDDINEVEFVTGCCIFARRSVFEKWQLPTDYFMYFEDVDYSLTLRKAGIKMYYTPNVTLYHKVSASVGIESSFFIYYWNRNRQILLKKHKNYFGINYYKSYCFFLASRFIKVFQYLAKREFEECISMLKGLRDGLCYRIKP